MVNRWTKEEENFLIETYPSVGTKCSVDLGRTVASVAKKASALGLKIENKTWGTEEEHFLIQNYYNLGSVECAKQLGISEGAVRLKANRLNLKSSFSKTKTHAQYIKDLVNKQILYTPEQEYISSHSKILHKCTKGHTFMATPDKILQGRGCPQCTKYGFNTKIPSILYYIKITKGCNIYYKIGVTNKSVKSRFDAEPSSTKITSILEIQFQTGAEAKEKEQEILKNYSNYRVTIPGFLVSNGNTELFSIDILGVDNNAHI